MNGLLRGGPSYIRLPSDHRIEAAKSFAEMAYPKAMSIASEVLGLSFKFKPELISIYDFLSPLNAQSTLAVHKSPDIILTLRHISDLPRGSGRMHRDVVEKEIHELTHSLLKQNGISLPMPIEEGICSLVEDIGMLKILHPDYKSNYKEHALGLLYRARNTFTSCTDRINNPGNYSVQSVGDLHREIALYSMGRYLVAREILRWGGLKQSVNKVSSSQEPIDICEFVRHVMANWKTIKGMAELENGYSTALDPRLYDEIQKLYKTHSAGVSIPKLTETFDEAETKSLLRLTDSELSKLQQVQKSPALTEKLREWEGKMRTEALALKAAQVDAIVVAIATPFGLEKLQSMINYFHLNQYGGDIRNIVLGYAAIFYLSLALLPRLNRRLRGLKLAINSEKELNDLLEDHRKGKN
jgi:hypothetical protein